MDARAFVALMDNSLVYTDYDGILEAKAAGQCEAAGHRSEHQVTESMNPHVYGDTAVVAGV